MTLRCKNTVNLSTFEVHKSLTCVIKLVINSKAYLPQPTLPFSSALAEENALLREQLDAQSDVIRQHQRLQQAGIALSRSTLTNLVKRAIALLRPIVDTQTQSVLRSRVLAIDETPVKSGHQGRAGLKEAR